jgi:hypothetical protein
MLDTVPAMPAKADGQVHAACASPAHAFFAAFREGTDGVRFASMAQDEVELARVAAAFRSAGSQTETWCRERLGWTSQAGRELAQALALAAGGWLLQGGGDMQVLERELGLAWRAFGESHLH